MSSSFVPALLKISCNDRFEKSRPSCADYSTISSQSSPPFAQTTFAAKVYFFRLREQSGHVLRLALYRDQLSQRRVSPASLKTACFLSLLAKYKWVAQLQVLVVEELIAQ